MTEQRHDQFVFPRALVEALLYLPQLVLELLYVVLGRPRLVLGLLYVVLGRPPRMVLLELLEKLLRNCCPRMVLEELLEKLLRNCCW